MKNLESAQKPTDEREEVRVIHTAVMLVLEPVAVEEHARDGDAEERAEHVDPDGAANIGNLQHIQEQVLAEDGDGRLEERHQQVLHRAELAHQRAEADQDNRDGEVSANKSEIARSIRGHPENV